jgi:hypothetical protein
MVERYLRQSAELNTLGPEEARVALVRLSESPVGRVRPTVPVTQPTSPNCDIPCRAVVQISALPCPSVIYRQIWNRFKLENCKVLGGPAHE